MSILAKNLKFDRFDGMMLNFCDERHSMRDRPSTVKNCYGNAFALALLSLSSIPSSWAACTESASGNPALTATAGSICNPTLTAYSGNNIAAAYQNGSVLNLQAGTSLRTTSSTSTYTLSSGGANFGGVGAQPAAALVHAFGDLSLTSSGNNSRGIYIYGGSNAEGQRSKLEVDGNLIALRSSGTGGAVIENSGGVINVMGSARISANAATTAATPVDAVRNSGSNGTVGSNIFNNGLTIYTAATGILNSAGSVQVLGASANINSTVGSAINITTGTVDMPVPATIRSSTGTAIIARGGQVALGNNSPTSATPITDTSLITIGTQLVTVQGANGIQASAIAGNRVEMNAGSVIATTGDAIAVNATGANNSIHILAGQLTASAGRAIFDGPGNGNTSVILEKDAIVSGEIVLGNGSDSLTINGTDLSQISLVDGGDDVSSSDGYVDRLTLAGINGSQPASKFLNWERISLTANSDFTLTGSTLVTGSGAVEDEAMGIVVDAGSILRVQEAAFTVSGDLNNQGQVALTNNQAGEILTVTGDYTGGGNLALDTEVGDSSSLTDVLHIKGGTTGTTILQINNLGGAGAVTTENGILVVQIDGASTGSFILADGALRVGDFIYSLQKVGNNWYLQSHANNGLVSVSKMVISPEGATAFSGAIPFKLTCTSPDFSQDGSIAVANNKGISEPILVTAGSICSVTEGALPAAPAGYEWGAVTLPVEATVPVGGNLTLAIENTLNKQNSPSAIPTPVPSLGQIALSLLIVLIGGFAALATKRSRIF